MQITEAEYELLKLLWQAAPQTARSLAQRLPDDRDWSDKTVKTLLGRLTKKGAIGYETRERTYWYSPVIKEAEYKVRETKSFMRRIFGGGLPDMVSGFAKGDELAREFIPDNKAEESIYYFKYLVDQYPNVPDVYNGLAYGYYSAGNIEPAQNAFAKSRSLNSNYVSQFDSRNYELQ